MFADRSRGAAMSGDLQMDGPNPGDLRTIKVDGGYISEPILQQAYRAEDGSVEWRTIPVEWVSYAEYQDAREER